MGKNCFKIIIATIITPLISFSAFCQNDTVSGDTISFESALSIMVEKNYSLQQAREYTIQKEQEMKATRGLYLPTISIGANYMVMSEDITLDLTPVRDAITPLYETLGNYGVFSGVPNPDPNTASVMPTLPDNISTQAVRGQLLEGLNTINEGNWNPVIQEKQFGVVNASFTQPIFTGGKIIRANQAAQAKVEEAKLQEEAKYSEVFCELVDRYYGLTLCNQVKRVREQVFQTMESHLSDAQHLKEQGIISNAEYLHAKVYWSDADRELKKAIRQQYIVNESLLNTLSIDTSLLIEPLSNLFYLFEIEPVEYFLEQSKINSDILKQVEQKKELAQIAYKAEVGSCMPQIAAMGTYDIYNHDLSPYVPEYMVGVGLKLDLFQGGSKMHKIKAAQFQSSQAESFYMKAESDIQTAITKYYQELSMYIEQLRELETASEFADEYYRVQEKAFSEGMATTTEVSDAQLQVAKIKTENLNAAYNFDVALARLLYFSGIPEKYQEYQTNPSTQFIHF